MIRSIRYALPVALMASAGLAQTQWNNASGGNWTDAANWDPMDVPDTPGESAEISLAGAYSVTLTSSVSIGNLSVLNPSAQVDIWGSRVMQLGGGIFNDGLIQVNSNSSTGLARLDFLSDATIAGTGVIALPQIDTRSLIESTTGATLTHDAGHTIRGRGRITANMVNDGTILGDVSGSELDLAQASLINNGAIRAEGGGQVRLISVHVDQSGGGEMLGDNGAITVRDGQSRVTRGVIDTSNGGLLEVFTGAQLVIDSTRLEGETRVYGSGAVLLEGGQIENNSTFIVNANASTGITTIDVLSDLQLMGTGEIVLPQIANRSLIESTAGAALTQRAGHVIRGRGRIALALINDGSIIGDLAGSDLELTGPTLVNNATVAADGGQIRLATPLIDQTGGGIVRASNNGILAARSTDDAMIRGGVLETLDTSSVQVWSGGALALESLRTDATIDVFGSGELRLGAGTIDNDGVITINANSSTGVTSLRVMGNTLLEGVGEVVLPQSGARSEIRTEPGAVLTQTASHTIRGRGLISAEFVNDGLVSGDLPGAYLDLFEKPKHNNGVMQAVGGGQLRINDCTVTQTVDAAIVADAGEILFPSGSAGRIIGGRLGSTNGGRAVVFSSGVAAFDGVESNAQIDIHGSGRVEVETGGLVNDGRIEVNSNNSTGTTQLRFTSTAAVTGTGEIRLSQLGARSAIESAGGVTGVIGAGQRVTGRGQLSGPLVLEGTVSPGLNIIDTLGLTGQLSMSPSAVYECEVRPNASDRLSGNSTATVVCDGTLAVINTDGNYAPAFGEEFLIIDADGGVSGAFSAVTGPSLPNPLLWRVRYGADTAVLIVSCRADANLDGAVNTQDVLTFLNLWTAGDPKADINGDGNVNTLDVLVFLNLWAAGC